MTRVFVAECPLCHTKFESDPGACPVCGSAPLRAIREAVAAAEEIPEPTRRTLPPAALRRGAARVAGRKAASPKVPAARGTPPRGPDGRFLPRRKPGAARSVPRVAHSAARGLTPAAKAAEELRRAAGGGSGMASSAFRVSRSSGGTTIRIDVRDAAARLREARRAASDRGREYRRARAALREAREALAATRNRGSAIERALRRIAAWLEDLFV